MNYDNKNTDASDYSKCEISLDYESAYKSLIIEHQETLKENENLKQALINACLKLGGRA
jgi:hypothetical protein